MMSFDDWKHDKVVAFAKASTNWRIVRDESKKKNYYYDKISKTSQWTVPSIIADYEKSLTQENYNNTFADNVVSANEVSKSELKRNISSVDVELEIPSELSDAKKLKVTESNPKNILGNLPLINQVELKSLPEGKVSDTVEDLQLKQLAKDNDLKRIEAILAQKDSVMEPDVVQHIKVLIQTHKQPPVAVVRGLVGTYTGYAQMSRIVLEWIALAEELVEPTKPSNSEDIVVSLVAQLIRQRFNRSMVDELVLQFKTTPTWLVELMRDDIFRAVMMDLHTANPSSTFLGLCMREIDTQSTSNDK